MCSEHRVTSESFSQRVGGLVTQTRPAVAARFRLLAIPASRRCHAGAPRRGSPGHRNGNGGATSSDRPGGRKHKVERRTGCSTATTPGDLSGSPTGVDAAKVPVAKSVVAALSNALSLLSELHSDGDRVNERSRGGGSPAADQAWDERTSKQLLFIEALSCWTHRRSSKPQCHGQVEPWRSAPTSR